MQKANQTQPNILRRTQVESIIGLGRSAIYERINPKSAYYDSTFPKPIKLGGGKKPPIGFIEAEVNAWLTAQIEKSRAAGVQKFKSKLQVGHGLITKETNTKLSQSKRLNMADYDNTNLGSIWKNAKKEADTHPDFTGELNVNGVEYWVSAWKRKEGASEKSPALSFSIKAKDEPKKSQSDSKPTTQSKGMEFEDDIPF